MRKIIDGFDKGTLLLVFLAAVLGFIILVLFMLNKNVLSSIDPSLASPKKKINIDEKIAEIKEKHPSIEYESSDLDGYLSFVYKNNDQYESLILNTTTGEELSFINIIKVSKLEEYLKKENELLNKKYPKFITDALSNKEVIKTYYVKNFEVIVYYYNYKLPYEYNEELNLKIDYNEIKDYLIMAPELSKSLEIENGYDYDPNKKAVALTFDDGPSGKYNPLILEELAKNKAHATFFMVGRMMNSCKSCVLNTYNSGNEIGSHTYDHLNIKTNNNEKVEASLNKTNELYNSITGSNIKLLRPPYGAYNKTNLENISNPLILWDLDTEDWRYRDVDHIVNYIKENVHDGAIILMHELYDSSYESLKIILPWLYKEGYQVVSVSELAELKGRTLESNHAYLSLR